MKTTISLFLCLAGATQIMAATVIPGVDTTTDSSGTIIGDIRLTEDVTWGKFGSSNALGTQTGLYGGDFYANDYTLSMWVDLAGLTGNTTLFGYSGTNPNLSQGYATNALVYNVETGTFLMGDGKLDITTGIFTSQRGDTSDVLNLGDVSKINITLSVLGANGSQTVGLYINGVLLDTLTYNGNMNGNTTNIQTWLNTNVTYGDIKLDTDKALSESEIPGFAGFAPVPEPATASLSLLGLAALMMRRKRA